MRPRVRSLVLSALAVVLVFGCALERGVEAGRPEEKKPRQAARDQARRRADQRLVPPGAGQHLAFDVRPRDYRRTTRYVLEITGESGTTRGHDVKKPRLLKRRTILVPLPALDPGQYALVVVAEGVGWSSRSASLTHRVPVRPPGKRSPQGAPTAARRVSWPGMHVIASQPAAGFFRVSQRLFERVARSAWTSDRVSIAGASRTASWR